MYPVWSGHRPGCFHCHVVQMLQVDLVWAEGQCWSAATVRPMDHVPAQAAVGLCLGAIIRSHINSHPLTSAMKLSSNFLKRSHCTRMKGPRGWLASGHILPGTSFWGPLALGCIQMTFSQVCLSLPGNFLLRHSMSFPSTEYSQSCSLLSFLASDIGRGG